MESQMSKTRSKFRNKIRRQQIDGFVYKTRKELLLNYEMAQEKEQLQKRSQIINDSLTRMILEGKITEIYELLYSNEKLSDTENLLLLNKINILNLYKLLKNTLNDSSQKQQIRCLLLLGSLILKCYEDIFLNFDLFNENKQFVRQLYERSNKIVHQIKNANSNQHKSSLVVDLNAYLLCMKNLVLRKDLQDNHRYFVEVSKEAYIDDFLIPWMLVLWDNPTFLIIFAMLADDELIYGRTRCLQFFTQNKELIDKLFAQTDYKTVENKVTSFPSLVIVNGIFYESANIEQKFLQSVFQPYIQMVIMSYKSCQSTRHKYYKFINFLDSLNVLKKIVKKLAQSQSKVNVFQIMGNEFWYFILTLLRVQTEKVRDILYEIVFYCLKNIDLKTKIANETNQMRQIAGILVEGSETENLSIILNSLRSIFILCIDLKSQSKDYQKLVEIFNQFQVAVILQNLVYHKNQQIAKYASQLIDTVFKEQAQLEKDKMDQEQI